MSSRTQELPAHVACRCLRSEFDKKIVASVACDTQMADADEPASNSWFVQKMLIIVAEMDLLPLPDTYIGKLMLTCKSAYAGLLESKIWLARLGYYVKNPEPSLAQYRVFLVLRENISNGIWDAAQLVEAGTFCSGGVIAQEVQEKVTAKKLTPLLVPVESSHSLEFWQKNLVDVLKIPNYPTSDQVEQVEKAMDKLLELGATGMDVVHAATSVQTPNKVLMCVLVKEYFKRRASGGEATPNSEAGASASSREGWTTVAALLRSIEMVLWSCQLLLGCDVANLRDNKKEAAPGGRGRGRGRVGRFGVPAVPPSDDKWLKGNYSTAFKRAVVHALGGQSWMQLSQCFSAARRGKVKAVFRNMHITAVVNSEIKALQRATTVEPDQYVANRASATARRYFAARSANEELLAGMKRVYLLAAMVREDKYPETAEEFEEREWGSCVVEPLAKMCEDRMFEMEASWQQPTFNPELAGKRLPHPFRNTVECVLARDGSNNQSWTKLFDSASDGVLTPNHIFANIRNLSLIDFEPGVVERFLATATEKGQINWVQALKGLLSIEHSLSQREVQKLRREITTAIEAEDAAEDGEVDALVTLPVKRTFKDKKGNVSEQEKKKRVARSFGQSTVAKYQEMLANVVGLALDGAVDAATKQAEVKRAKAKQKAEDAAMDDGKAEDGAMEVAQDETAGVVTRAERAAVLVLTPEMVLNVTRTGVPPSIPDFSRTSLWRNEAVSMAQIAGPGEPVEKLLVGITWKVPVSGYGIMGMVLDVSVMLFDSSWNYVDECSWQKLESEGLKHSGDWCGQLAMLQSLGQSTEDDKVNARETIEIDVQALRARAPYVATVPRARRVEEALVDGDAMEEDEDLRGAVGKVRYVVVGSFAWSNHSIEDFNAAAYVANPAVRGSGPGGMAVLAAQKLTGQGKVNVGLMLDLYHPEGGVVAVNVDHTLGVTSKNAASSAFPEVREECRAVLQGLEGGVRISSLGMLFGAALTDKVVVVHGGEKEAGEGRLVADGGSLRWTGLDTAPGGVQIRVGGERAWDEAAANVAAAGREGRAEGGEMEVEVPREAEVTVVEREAGEGTMAFYARVAAGVRSKRCTLRPVEGLGKCREVVKDLKEVVVMTGELDDEEQVAKGLGDGEFQGKVVVANLRGYERKRAERAVEGWEESRTMGLVHGWDVVDLLVDA